MGSEYFTAGAMGLSKAYLVLYNAVQTIGWSVLLAQILLHYVRGGTHNQLYDAVHTTVQIFQTAAVLEILHSAFGLVKSNIQVTFQQVFSRVYVVWAILYLCPSSQLSRGVPLLLLAWTLTEIIRYSMYAIQLVGTPPYFLTWIRYTFFIVAYPTGVSGELLCMYSAFLEASANKRYSLTMPNAFNATFSFPLIIAAVGLAYIPFFPQMYLHVFSLRRKVLGPKKTE